MTTDHSAGWDAVAERFMAIRSEIGVTLVRSWARDSLPSSAAILDIGCGSGVPIAQALVDDGFSVWGIDASPSLISAYRRQLPDMPAACEPVLWIGVQKGPR
jgi:2-polyprenyl-3-methyl-5-hydroxy-6-metoxy-1,4-benzoquinol methylase